MGVFRQFIAGVLTRWGAVPLADRYRIAVVAAVVPVACFTMVLTAPSSGTMTRLVTCKNASDALGVQRLLKAKHVVFEVRDNGQTILVPADLRAELTIELAQTALWKQAVAKQAKTPPTETTQPVGD